MSSLTPIYPFHLKSGAKIIDFFGWQMPLYYSSVLNEAKVVREKAGVFDVSHMGEIEISGSSALTFLNKMVTCDISLAYPGKVIYTLICSENGGIIDDLTVYCIDTNRYFLVVNAINTEKDFQFLNQHLIPGVNLKNLSSQISLISIQGPNSTDILKENELIKLPNFSIKDLKYYHFTTGKIKNTSTLISRTGYTGEKGYEIYVPSDKAFAVWEEVISCGVQPCGLGARDILRIEAGYLLYGEDIDEDTNPFEANLDWLINLEKDDFIGKMSLSKIKEKGLDKKITFFEMLEAGPIPRKGHQLYSKSGEKIGEVTSGVFSPNLNKNIGIGYLNTEEKEFFVEIRNKKYLLKGGKKGWFHRI